MERLRDAAAARAAASEEGVAEAEAARDELEAKVAATQARDIGRYREM